MVRTRAEEKLSSIGVRENHTKTNTGRPLNLAERPAK
jgi:hypothetical protein